VLLLHGADQLLQTMGEEFQLLPLGLGDLAQAAQHAVGCGVEPATHLLAQRPGLPVLLLTVAAELLEHRAFRAFDLPAEGLDALGQLVRLPSISSDPPIEDHQQHPNSQRRHQCQPPGQLPHAITSIQGCAIDAIIAGYPPRAQPECR